MLYSVVLRSTIDGMKFKVSPSPKSHRSLMCCTRLGRASGPLWPHGVPSSKKRAQKKRELAPRNEFRAVHRGDKSQHCWEEDWVRVTSLWRFSLLTWVLWVWTCARALLLLIVSITCTRAPLTRLQTKVVCCVFCEHRVLLWVRQKYFTKHSTIFCAKVLATMLERHGFYVLFSSISPPCAPLSRPQASECSVVSVRTVFRVFNSHLPLQTTHLTFILHYYYCLDSLGNKQIGDDGCQRLCTALTESKNTTVTMLEYVVCCFLPP